MELWIRSQDRECLMQINRVDYDLASGEHRIMVNGYETLVATYKTKERALEVLDEIHQRLINLQCIELIGAANITQQMKRNGVDCVYEMPID